MLVTLWRFNEFTQHTSCIFYVSVRTFSMRLYKFTGELLLLKSVRLL
jgi:hypothetical protein